MLSERNTVVCPPSHFSAHRRLAPLHHPPIPPLRVSTSPPGRFTPLHTAENTSELSGRPFPFCRRKLDVCVSRPLPVHWGPAHHHTHSTPRAKPQKNLFIVWPCPLFHPLIRRCVCAHEMGCLKKSGVCRPGGGERVSGHSELVVWCILAVA